MPTVNLLFRKQLPVNDSICLTIPTIGQVLDDEDGYYGMVSMLTAMPIDLMAQLDEAGIDFSEINDYELFLILFEGIKTQDTSLIFGNLDLSKFRMAKNEQNGDMVLIDPDRDIVIDRMVQYQIAEGLRKIHHLEKNRRKPANKEAKEFMLKRARAKLRRQRGKREDSQLESLIVALVNTEQFKYNYEQVRDLTIYQFNESVRQVVKKIDFDNRMIGVYSGTIDTKSLSQDDLNWLTHK